MKTSPEHVAVVMDGCQRWLAQPGRDPLALAEACVRAAFSVTRAAAQGGVRYLTLCGLREVLSRPLPTCSDETPELELQLSEALRRHEGSLTWPGLRVRVAGELGGGTGPLRRALSRLCERSEAGAATEPERLRVSVALGGSGRSDLVRAAQRLAQQVAAGLLRPEDVDPERVRAELPLSALPDPDLIICTGGTQRLPAVLTFESAYAELLFADELWPDFGATEILRALDDFSHRERRFGKTGEQVKGGELGASASGRAS